MPQVALTLQERIGDFKSTEIDLSNVRVPLDSFNCCTSLTMRWPSMIIVTIGKQLASSRNF